MVTFLDLYGAAVGGRPWPAAVLRAAEADRTGSLAHALETLRVAAGGASTSSDWTTVIQLVVQLLPEILQLLGGLRPTPAPTPTPTPTPAPTPPSA